MAGLLSVVGFKVEDQYGHGLAGEGFILDNNNDTVQRFRTLRFGMGQFTFTPQKENTYKAVMLLKNGMRVSKSLSLANANGYVMHLSEKDENSIQIEVTASVSDVPVYLFVHTRGVMKTVQQKDLQNSKAVFLIDKNLLGEGISQLTVFAYNLRPVCERLYFKQPEQKTAIANEF